MNKNSQAVAFSAFQKEFPDFASTHAIDELRASDYSRLDLQNQVYLDYTGGGLYGENQLRQHMALLQRNVFGNPHSQNPTSLAMTEWVEESREYVLRYFKASPTEYEVIFTPNASGALKLVGESYPFSVNAHYALTFDNHNSVNGIREFARAKGATVTYIPLLNPELRVDSTQLANVVQGATSTPNASRLLAFPAQSNFSGVQHPLQWIEFAQSYGWDVLVDCAAFAPTNRLDLQQWKPDFVPISFYKIFGYPTGLGCLLVRKPALRKLRRPWFAGGTITITSVQGEGWHFLNEGSAGFEDGTINYLNIPAVKIGLQQIEQIGIDTIHRRVAALTGWVLKSLCSLRHRNGAALVSIYGPKDLTERGGTIAFNFLDVKGEAFDQRRIEMLANRANISLRTGCFCNPGAGETAHHLSREEMAPYFSGEPLSFNEFYELAHAHGKSPSTIRISVGLASNFADVYRFVEFAKIFLDQKSEEINALPLPTSHSHAQRDTA